MNGFDYYKKVLNQYADISGRASRSEYWYFVLFNMIFAVGLASLSMISEYMMVFYVIYLLAVLVPGFCVAVRRLHDIGKSGTYLLVALIPFVGGIILLIWYLSESQPGENKWGPNPWEMGEGETNISEHLV
jgi:uncharacterized membrane protein YhaH (DUF805 family)